MNYELVLMLKASLTEDDVKKSITSVKELIKSLNGKVEKEDYWGKRKLSYEIKGKEEAYYTIFDVTIEKSQVKKLISKLNIEPNVIRHLFINKD